MIVERSKSTSKCMKSTFIFLKNQIISRQTLGSHPHQLQVSCQQCWWHCDGSDRVMTVWSSCQLPVKLLLLRDTASLFVIVDWVLGAVVTQVDWGGGLLLLQEKAWLSWSFTVTQWSGGHDEDHHHVVVDGGGGEGWWGCPGVGSETGPGVQWSELHWRGGDQYPGGSGDQGRDHRSQPGTRHSRETDHSSDGGGN